MDIVALQWASLIGLVLFVRWRVLCAGQRCGGTGSHLRRCFEIIGVVRREFDHSVLVVFVCAIATSPGGLQGKVVSNVIAVSQEQATYSRKRHQPCKLDKTMHMTEQDRDGQK